MSRIAELIGRLEVIPDKEKRATQLGEMVAIRDKLRTSADLAVELRTRCAALKAVEGADFVGKTQDGLTSASSAALRLKDRFGAGRDFDRKRADDTLTTINERLGNARTTIDKGWQVLVDRQGARFKPLADAAQLASLPGAEKLIEAITALEDWRDTPPKSQKDATSYVADAKRIPASITELGLEGNAGRFMVNAASGCAPARDLQDAEVLAFLDAYPAVWLMLKVGL